MTNQKRHKTLNILRIELSSIQIELDSLNNYIDDIAENIYQKQTELEKLHAETRDDSPDFAEELDSYFSDEYHRYHQLFPTFAYNSTLVSQFSFFESRLKILCELDQSKNFSPIKLSDLAGKDIDKCKKYLQKVVGLNFSDVQNNWKKITDIQNLRNNIVHNASVIPNDPHYNDIINIIKSDKRITFSEQDRNFYINDISFLKNFNQLILDVFTWLVNKLSANRVIARNTSMPHNNEIWGQEKTEYTLMNIIQGLQLLNENEIRTDEYKESDLTANMKGILESMAFDMTKLLAFFSDGDWDPTDRDMIVEKGEEGLTYLRKVYKEGKCN